MILTINGGSSSIKFALFELGKIPEKAYYGQLTRVGTTGARFVVNGESKSLPVAATSHRS
jgi:acetate kinase